MALRVWEARCVAMDAWYGSAAGKDSRDRWAEEEVRRNRQWRQTGEHKAAARFARSHPPVPPSKRGMSSRANKGFIGWGRIHDAKWSREDAGEDAEFEEKARYRAQAAGARLPWY